MSRIPNSSPIQKSTRGRKKKKASSLINWNEILISDKVSGLKTDISGSSEILESEEVVFEDTRYLIEKEERVYSYLYFLRFKVVPYIREIKSDTDKNTIDFIQNHSDGKIKGIVLDNL